MTRHLLAGLLALAACGPETTSFRTTDASDPARPSASLQVVKDGARIDVWSNGGYIGSSDEPMTHVGFDIRNTSANPLVFDTDALSVTVFDRRGAPLPATRFVALTPLGPAQIAVGPGETRLLDTYFMLPVTPRAVQSMRVQWTVRIGDHRYPQTSSFVRDDDYPVLELPASPST